MRRKYPIEWCIFMEGRENHFRRKGDIHMKKKVLIADGDERFRNELVAALETSEEFRVDGVAADGEEAIHMLQQKRPDILVLDLLLTKYDGLAVLEHIRTGWHHPKILVTSAFMSSYVAASAVRLGAQQLLHKPCEIEVVVKNLQRMETGNRNGTVIFLGERERSLEALVTSVLHDIGVPAHIKGYQYLREALILAVTDEDDINAIQKNRYNEVAQMFDTMPKRVEQAIRHAIEVAWDRGDLDTLQGFFGYTVSNTKGKPTNSEFIAIVADRVRLWMKENTDKLS